MRVALACCVVLLGCAKKPRSETSPEPVVALRDAGHAMGDSVPDAAPMRAISSEPDSHRPTAGECGKAVEKGNGDPRVPGCKRDKDCPNGPHQFNGRCINHPGGHAPPRNACVWDGCFADADCGKGACVCSGGAVGNHCLGGNCAIDADCGAGGFCSPSRSDERSCFGAGPVGNFCHRPKDSKDECMKREDCKQPDDCVFSPAVGHWQCKDVFSHCPVG